MKTQHAHRIKSSQHEEGMAIGISLMVGLLLLVGSTGLMAKHLMSRRGSSVESYKQISELAAANGLNRIVRLINSENSDNDLSYLWSLNKSAGDWDLPESQLRAKLLEPCSELKHRNNWNIQQQLLGADLSQGRFLRNGSSNKQVGMSFKLSSQESTSSNESAISVEGFATQSDNTLLARSKIQRKFELREIVANEDDFGVISAVRMLLGRSSIQGPGSILWLVDNTTVGQFSSQSRCNPSSLASAVGANHWSTADRIWPIKKSFPSTGLFDTPIVNKDARQSWWFGTNPSDAPYPCNNSACFHNGREWVDATQHNTRNVHVEKQWPYLKSSPARTISLHSEQICNGNRSKACLIAVNGIQLKGHTTLAIETSSSQGPRPVVLRADGNTHLDLSGGQLCQSRFSNSSLNKLTCNPAAAPENLVVVATQLDASSERIISYLNDKANVAVNAVFFSVFEDAGLADGV